MGRRICRLGLAVGLTMLWHVPGCGTDGPPLDELTVRDALLAEPGVIAAMPPASQVRLAERFEAVRHAQHDEDSVSMTQDAMQQPAQMIHAVDEQRRGHRADALLGAGFETETSSVRVQTYTLREQHNPRALPLPPLEGLDVSPTQDEELRALAGQAGDVLHALVLSVRARHLVRVVAWPVGFAVVGDTVFVNASWLVAMAALTPADASVAQIVRPNGLSGGVAVAQSFHVNPYRLYASIEACVADVRARCDTCLGGGACDDSATLGDFANGRAECVWLSGDADSTNAELLCAAGLLSVGSVAACVRAADPTCAPPALTNTQASVAMIATFTAQPACVTALDQCLAGDHAAVGSADAGPPPSTGYSTGGSGCSGPSCSGPSCTEPSCSSPSCASSGCSGSSCSSGSCSSCGSSSSSSSCRCDATPAGPADPWTPVRTLLFASIPLLYLLARGRRA